MTAITCSTCRDWPCACVEAECLRCAGEGGSLQEAGLATAGFRGDGEYVPCTDCDGSGSIQCQRGGVDCPFEHCYCEAAWERQQDANASEPPPSVREQHEAAYRQKQELRR